MRTDLAVRAAHRGGMRVDVNVRGHAVAMDYPAEGNNLPTPLEMLLASLAACAANTVALVLTRKLGVQLDGLEVQATAERREEHPTLLTAIELRYAINANAPDPAVIERAIHIAEEQLCPVMAMLRPGASITSSWSLEEA